MTDDTATFVMATGARATQTVARVDGIVPQLVAFVRGTARWLDPDFPQRGRRGDAVDGSWTDDEGVETVMQQVEELYLDERGLRIIRLRRLQPPEGPHEGAVRVIAVGLGDGAKLELRWNFLASDTEVRGTSAALIVDGARRVHCVADFQRWFE
jgi:hypothetical protein